MGGPKILGGLWTPIKPCYQNIDDHNPSRKRKILIVFDGMIAEIE